MSDAIIIESERQYHIIADYYESLGYDNMHKGDKERYKRIAEYCTRDKQVPYLAINDNYTIGLFRSREDNIRLSYHVITLPLITIELAIEDLYIALTEKENKLNQNI